MRQLIDLFDNCEDLIDDSRDFSPFINERKGSIYLRFNAFQVQSEMYRYAPNELVLGYTRTMMDFLLLKEQPRHIGMIVGGRLDAEVLLLACRARPSALLRIIRK